jgi:simple sugar transport system substrate-binding protein
MGIRKKAIGLTALALASALTLAACSSTGGRAAQESLQSQVGGGGGQVAETERYRVAFITHAAPGDLFWDKIRNGAEAAAAKDNIELLQSQDPAADKQATLIQSAIDSGVDAIATTLSTPDALKPAVQAAIAAGIPVVSFNAGLDQYEDVGSMMYFGSDETLAGEAVGERLAAEGAQHPLCVIQEAGQVQLEARCAGVATNAPGTENLQVNGRDLPSVTSTIAAKLQADPSIDYVVTLGAQFATAALDSASQANSSAKVVTFDLDADVAQAIKDGTIVFSVDQQPYLQGYLAVDSLWLYLTNRNTIGGGGPVLTGPAFVDSTNIDAILPFTQNNTR